MLQRRQRDSVVFYASPLLEKVGVPHGFSTRIGGVSAVPFDSMNLGTLGKSEVQDSIENIRANNLRFRKAIGCEDRESCNVFQVHGNTVLVARAGEHFENGRQADAIVSDDAARVVSVKYADCVPILLAREDGRYVGAVHAGWRGIVGGAPSAAVAALCKLGKCAADSLIAAIGPCIGFDAFEVGSEVLARFGELFEDRATVRKVGEKGRVDLREATRRQLIQAGVGENRIDTTDRCTFTHDEEFFSHRRDFGITGRMAAFIGAKGER